MTDQALIACHECDLLHPFPQVPQGARAKCIRCGAILHAYKENSLNRTLSLVLAGLILFFISNMFPVLGMQSRGLAVETTLIEGVKTLYVQGMPELSLLVLLTCLLFPFIQLTGLLYILLPLKYGWLPPKTAIVFRFIQNLQPWSMMEVFMLGILVSIVKLAKMASIIAGLSLYSFAALIVVLVWAVSSLDPHLIWGNLGIRHE